MKDERGRVLNLILAGNLRTFSPIEQRGARRLLLILVLNFTRFFIRSK